MFVRYFFNQDTSNGLGTSDNIPGLPHLKYFRNQNVAIDWNHVFSPNLLNPRLSVSPAWPITVDLR